MIAGILTALIQAAAGGAIGYLSGGIVGLLIGAAVGLIFGVIFGWAIASAGAYEASVGGVFAFIVDHTWSLPNTIAGAIYLALHLMFGHSLDRETAKDSSRLTVTEGAFPGFATTIGTVIAGASGSILAHEDVHVLEARISGPIYLPAVILNYIIFTIAPVWLFWHNYSFAPINSFGRYFMCGVYPHVWNEAIAYGVQGTPPH